MWGLDLSTLGEVRFSTWPARVQGFNLSKVDGVLTSPTTVGLCCTELQQSPGLTVCGCNTAVEKGIRVQCFTLVVTLAFILLSVLRLVLLHTLCYDQVVRK